MRVDLIRDLQNADNAGLLEAAIDSLTQDDNELYIPPGHYYFTRPVKPITKNIVITGAGINATVLMRNYNADPVQMSSLLHIMSTSYLSKFAIDAAPGTVGGMAIRIEGLGASGTVLRDMWISGIGGGNWQIPLCIYGGNHSMGVRSITVDNVEIFAATVHIVWVVNCHGGNFNMRCYPAGGTVDHITVQDYNAYRSGSIVITSSYLTRVYAYRVDNLLINSLGTVVNRIN